jgi:PAS domain S-box-containing protein
MNRLDNLAVENSKILKNYFTENVENINILSQTYIIKNAFSKFQNGYQKLDSSILKKLYISQNPFFDKYLLFSSKENTLYDKIHLKYHDLFLGEVKKNRYYDLLLVDKDGNILYTANKNFDFNTNIKNFLSNSKGLQFEKRKIIAFNQFIFISSQIKDGGFLIAVINKKNIRKIVPEVKIELKNKANVSNTKNEILSSIRVLNIYDIEFVITVEAKKSVILDSFFEDIIYVFFSMIFGIVVIITLVASFVWKHIVQPLEIDKKDSFRKKIVLEKELALSKQFLMEYKKAVDNSSILSKTDISGKITYVNEAFCKISQFRKDELIGKTHNIVRHPDMPSETFIELWSTILKKRVWKGVIRNRKKDGSDYYVNSSIVPILNDRNEIKEFVSIRNDITEIFKQNKIIVQQMKDVLTGLYTREKFLEDILNTQSLKMAVIRTVELEDVQNFYGVKIWETLIQRIVSQIQNIFSEKGIRIYRTRDDEFAVVVSSTLNIYFEKRVLNLIHYFNHNVISIDDNNFNISINVGCAIGENKNLFLNSEMALREAIKTQKEVVFFDETKDFHKIYQNNIEMTTKIKRAISKNDIVIFGQKIVGKNSSKYEVLIRMVDGEKTLSPFFFLSVAKKARLYPTLTKIVISKAIEYFKDKEDEFSINLSIEDISNSDMVAFLKRRIEEYEIGHRLILEIVESEGIENFDEVSKFVKEIRELDCRIAIDDFGTGYSNFEYLLKLDVDFIKIDGSLIKNLDTSKNSRIVVELIVEFAKRRDIEVVAEFVHNEKILNIVETMGIDFFQGFHLAEPELLI